MLGPNDVDTAFDARAVSGPIVDARFRDDGEAWTMWYTGTNADGVDSVGVATSSDGIAWNRGSGDAVMYRSDGSSNASVDVGRVLGANAEDWWTFDVAGACAGDVRLISSDAVRGASVYWMFYHGYDHAAKGAKIDGRRSVDGAEDVTTRVGLCLSQDGRNWARIEGEHHTGALFDVGEEGAWDHACVRDPKVLLAGPRDIRVYYASMDPSTGTSYIGCARTKDGFVYPASDRSAVPMFAPGPPGSFDDAGVGAPCVARLGKEEFVMFYEAYSARAPGVSSIAVATSRDGVTWTRPSKPALERGEEGAWDHGGVGKPYAVPMAGDRVRLYYEGRARAGDDRGSGVGVALSVDGDRFSFARRVRADVPGAR